MNTRNWEVSQAEWLCPHPAGLVAAGLVAGIMVGDRLDAPTTLWISLAVIAAAAIPWIRHEILRTATALILVFSSGAGGQSLVLEVPGSDIVHLTRRLERDVSVGVTVTGRVSSFVTADSTRIRFYLNVQRLHGRDHAMSLSGQVRVTLRKTFKSPLRAGRSECSEVRRGMRLALRGALSRPNTATNPADFDYREFLRRKGVGSLLYVRHLEECMVMNASVDRIARLRSWFKQAIGRSVPRSSRALPTALITGDRSGLDPETRREFAESGLMHLLAISGLHVLFVGLAAYGLLKSTLARFRFRWRLVESASTAVTLTILSGYALVTGATPSVVRASIMAAVFLSSRPLFRTPNGLNSLGVAAIVVLLIDPNSLFTAGFQLSFSAVFGLITAGSFTAQIVNDIFKSSYARWAIGLLAASLVATLSTAPVMVYQFGYVPLAGLFLNLLAIPLASVLLVASILATLLAGMMPTVAAATGYSADLLSTFLEFLAGAGTQTTSWSLLRPPGRIPYLVLPMALLFALYPGIERASRVTWLLISLALPAVDLVHGAASKRFRPDLDVIFLDVGHGDGALVEFPSGKTMLVDAGNRGRTWDYGQRVVLPHLHRQRISTIDFVVVSHPHGDHFGGLPSILRSHPVGCVYDNGKHTESRLFAEYLDLVTNVTRCRRTLNAGITLDVDPQVRVEVLAPPSGYEQDGENDESVVIKIRYGTTSILFTGDVELDAEGILTKGYCDRLETDVMKVPHHGSRTSSTTELVACSKARWAVVSVGKPDKYGLPDEEIIKRWKDAGSTVLTTRSGAIRFRSNGRDIHLIQKSTSLLIN